MIYQLKKGANLRLLFKVGKLISKAGRIYWKTMRDDKTTMSTTTS